MRSSEKPQKPQKFSTAEVFPYTSVILHNECCLSLQLILNHTYNPGKHIMPIRVQMDKKTSTKINTLPLLNIKKAIGVAII